jgi:hypothetical protein
VAQTGEPYAYTGDDPVNWVDPLGQSWYDPSWAHTAVDRLTRGAKKVGHFVATHKQAVIVAATIVATLPLDLTGAGEAIDAGVIGAEATADVTTDVVADEVTDEAAEEATEEGASCGGQSFTPDTKVVLANGTKIPISKVRVGDMVLATDTVTGKTRAERVTTLWVNHDSDLMDITVKTSSGTSTIKSTQHHLFWDLATHTWVQADNLSVGTALQTRTGAAATVVSTNVVPGADDMWDLTVDNDHDFYVVVSAGSQTAVLVHNCPDLDSMSESGQQPDRNGFSQAGRALQKHLNRPSDSFDSPFASGGGSQVPDVMNQAGQDTLDEILTNPQSAVQSYGNTIDMRLPWGGARFVDGGFTGFLNP